MKRIIQQFSRKRDGLDEKLKHHLDGLPPEAKLNIILLMIAGYLIATIFVFAGIVRQRNKEAMNIRHIEPMPLIDSPVEIPQQEQSDTAYQYLPELKPNNNHTVNKNNGNRRKENQHR